MGQHLVLGQAGVVLGGGELTAVAGALYG
jgi:hypothetical protein